MESNDYITERRQVKEALYLNELQLRALLQLNEMAEQPIQMIADFALEKAIELTRSKVGYLAFMNADETLQTLQWSRKVQRAGEPGPQTYPVTESSRWAEAVRQRRPVIANHDAPPNSSVQGAPDSVELVRHTDVPVFDGERIVAVAGVGSKEAPYDENDVRQLTLLMSGCGDWRSASRGKIG